MRWLIAPAALLVCSGCTTPEKLLSNVPIYAVTTTLAPEAAVNHVRTEWGKHWIPTPMTHQEGATVVLTWPNPNGGPVAIVKAEPSGTGSMVKMWRWHGTTAMAQWEKDAIETLPKVKS